MGRARDLVLVSVLAIGLVGCSGGQPPAPWAAKVNGQEILVSQVAQALKRFEATDQFDQLAERDGAGTARRQYERTYLVNEIKRLVLRWRAEALGIDVADEVAKRMQEITSGYPSDEELRRAIEASGYTLAEFKGLIEDQVLEQALREHVTAEVTRRSDFSEQELKEYYRSYREEFRQAEVQLIVVKEESVARRLSTTLRESSPGALDDEFAELARKHSTDKASAVKGGRLGWVSPGQLLVPVEAALEDLRIGEVSPPVPTDSGVYVVRVTGRRLQPFEAVKGEISERLTDNAARDAWSEWLNDSYGRATIELNPRYGKLDPGTGQIVDRSAKPDSR
jgi:peptidyl-prolyl cis-trans isomerase SurA